MYRAVGRQRPSLHLPVLAMVLGLLILGLAGCNSVDPVVKIGLVAPFEGAERAIGYDVIFSARLAVREINAAGGIDGTRVALVALDDRADAALARDAAASLIIDPDVVAVVGHWDAETTAVVAPQYAAAGLPFFPLAGAEARYPEMALPEEFVERYTAVTPFDEQPGPYAAVTYDTFQFLWAAMRRAAEEDGINRAGLQAVWGSVEYAGIAGQLAAPPAKQE